MINSFRSNYLFRRSYIPVLALLIAVACFSPRFIQLWSSSQQEAVAESTSGSLLTKPIEQVQVGERVLGQNPNREEVQSFPDPDPRTWRKLELMLPKEEGHEVEVTLLRPLDWIEEVKAEIGNTIWLDMAELGAVGNAKVLSIGPCPDIQSGNGNVVTGTFAHDPDTDLLNIQVEGCSEPLGTTTNHPFWSEDRQEFVEAGELKVGEKVRSRLHGIVAITAIEPRPFSERVYNIEVHNEHVYEVGLYGTLVHNTYGKGAEELPNDVEYKVLFKGLSKAQKSKLVDEEAGYQPEDFITQLDTDGRPQKRFDGADFATDPEVAKPYAFRGGGAHVVKIPRKTWNELVRAGLIVDDENMQGGGSVTIRSEAFDRLNREAESKWHSEKDDFDFFKLFGHKAQDNPDLK